MFTLYQGNFKSKVIARGWQRSIIRAFPHVSHEGVLCPQVSMCFIREWNGMRMNRFTFGNEFTSRQGWYAGDEFGLLKIWIWIWILGCDVLLTGESVRKMEVCIVSDKEVLVLECWELD
jgi:hypothetical protein